MDDRVRLAGLLGIGRHQFVELLAPLGQRPVRGDLLSGLATTPAADLLALPVPQHVGHLVRLEQARQAGAILGDAVWQQFPWASCEHLPQPKVEGLDAAARLRAAAASHAAPGHLQARPTTTDPVEGLLNRTWRPALSVIGAADLPLPRDAGNVLRPRTTLKLSMRLPPTVDAELATAAIKKALESDPPYGARVRFEADHAADGWSAAPTAPWLARALEEASQRAFGRPVAWIGEGGTIPFMAMLGRHFPQAQFVVTGVLITSAQGQPITNNDKDRCNQPLSMPLFQKGSPKNNGGTIAMMIVKPTMIGV